MDKLHQLGVTGSLWTLIDDCRTNTFCCSRESDKLGLVVCQTRRDTFYLSLTRVSTGSRKRESQRRNPQRKYIKSNLSRRHRLCSSVSAWDTDTSEPGF